MRETWRQIRKAQVAALFPVRLGIGITDPLRESDGELFHVEQDAIRNAAPVRQREFRAGRIAARMAQHALGLAPRPVPMGHDRAPIWPEGLCGSISHAGGTCIAVASNDPEIKALGLDIEERLPLPDDILETVLHPNELNWINRQPDPGELARLFFSAKECAYKAQYPLSGQLFDFDTIAIEVDLTKGAFVARFTRPVPPFDSGTRLSGRMSVTNRLILTAITLPA